MVLCNAEKKLHNLDNTRILYIQVLNFIARDITFTCRLKNSLPLLENCSEISYYIIVFKKIYSSKKTTRIIALQNFTKRQQ